MVLYLVASLVTEVIDEHDLIFYFDKVMKLRLEVLVLSGQNARQLHSTAPTVSEVF